LNISNPQLPVVLGTFGRNYGSFTAINLFALKPYVYWAEGYLGVVDISDSSHPVEKALFLGNNWITGVAASKNLVIATDGLQGVWIFRNNMITSVDDSHKNLLPLEYELSQNFPNPFNPKTTIEFSLPRREHITLEIYNLLGQKERTLINEIVEAGNRQIAFDALNLPSGIYFYRLSNSKSMITKKMVILR
jgi:hypothetical protein